MATCAIIGLMLIQAVTPPLPTKPEYGHYVSDGAQLLDVSTEHVIDSIGARRYAEGRPLYVVTIDSLPSDAASGDDALYRYAAAIHDGWRIGEKGAASRGTLVLIDAKARRSAILFGRGWGSLHDGEGLRLTRDTFDPALASDAPSDAVLRAVRVLSQEIAARNAWIVRGLAMIPLFAIFVAWLSYGRIRGRARRREDERAAVFASVAMQAANRQRAILDAAGKDRPPSLRPSDPPS